MNILPHARVSSTNQAFPDRFKEQLGAEELALVEDVSSWDDTRTLLVEDMKTGTLAAYAVIGPADDGMLAIYAARSWFKGLAAHAIKGLFNGASILGKPMFVHTEKIAAYARILGAEHAFEAMDTDGVPLGVFAGQKAAV